MLIFQNGQNELSCAPPLWSALVHKIAQFWAKLAIRTAHHTFQESRRPEVTKNPNYVLSLKGS